MTHTNASTLIYGGGDINKFAPQQDAKFEGEIVGGTGMRARQTPLRIATTLLSDPFVLNYIDYTDYGPLHTAVNLLPRRESTTDTADEQLASGMAAQLRGVFDPVLATIDSGLTKFPGERASGLAASDEG